MHFQCQIEDYITACENTLEDAVDWRMNFLGVSPSDSLFAVFDNFHFTDIMEYTEAPWSPEIRLHDCMWSGICVDMSHPNRRKPNPSEIDSMNVQSTQNPVQVQQETMRNQMSELLTKKTSPRQIMTYNYVRATMTKDSVPAGESILRKVVPNPQTNNKQTLQTNPVNVCSDVCNSMNNLCIDGRLSINFINQHNIKEEQQHKRDLCILGVQTPSDSDKVILPTNPSAEDCQTLQATLAAKMSGIKQIKREPMCDTNSSFSPYCKTEFKPIAIKEEIEFVSNSKRKRHNSFDEDFVPKPLAKKRRPQKKPIDDIDYEYKRKLHNILERQRRIGLKKQFEQLRTLVPKLAELKSVSKKRILREAATYCIQLKLEDSLRNHLITENDRLLNQFSMIKNNARSMRRKQKMRVC
ncbi:unnamed protein product [Diamesa tonsa]